MKKRVGIKECLTVLGIFLVMLTLGQSVWGAETVTAEHEAFMQFLAAAELPLPKANEPVTRRQFVMAAAALFGEENPGAVQVSFTDVPADDPLYPILEQAVAMGLISDGETFRPEDPVLLDECLKICCVVSGYSVKAELFGGYPTGYRRAANQAGISGGNLSGEEVNGALARQLLWNTLNVDVLEPSSYGGETVQYTAKKGNNLLVRLYGLETAEGVLNANEYTAMGVKEPVDNTGRIEIDGTGYGLGFPEANDYLGYRVRGYYRKDDPKKTVVYILPLENRVLELRCEDADYDPISRKIGYGEKKSRYAALETGFEYIYNGKTDFQFGSEPIPKSGRLVLIDNDDNGKYDVLAVQEVYYLQVGEVNKLYSTISDVNHADRTLELGASDCRYEIFGADGESLSLVDVRSGDILAAEVSRDRKLIRLSLCDNSVSGILERVAEKRLTIGGETYEVDPVFAEFCRDEIQAGGSYVLILGLDGRVVACWNGEEQYTYGYLYNAALEGIGFSPKLSVKIFSSDGKHLTVSCTEKVKLDGVRTEQERVFSAICAEGKPVPQLVRYCLNKEGLLSGLDIADLREEPEIGEQENPENSLTGYHFPGTVNFRQQIFYPYFNAASATVFKIPTDLQDEKNFAVGYQFADGDYGNVFAYDLDRAGRAKAIVYRSGEGGLRMDANSGVMILEEVFTSIDEEGIPRTKVNGWENGRFKEYFLDEEISVLKHGAPAELTGGDVIRFAESGGVISMLTVDFDGASMQPNTGAGVAPFNGKSSVLQYQAGTVYSAEGGYMYLSKTPAGAPVNTGFSGLCNVRIPGQLAVFDCRTGTLRTGDASFIRTALSHGEDAVYMVVKQHYMSSQCGFIYVLDNGE